MKRFLDPEGRSFIILAGALTAQAAMAVDVLLPALPIMIREMAMTPSSAQLTIGMFMAGFALGQIAWGWLSDWVGRRPVILIGSGGYALTTLMCALSDSGSELVFWRLILGVFSSASVAATRAMMRDNFTGTHLARQMSAITAIFFLSPIIAPQLGTVLMLTGSWRSVFWVPGIISVLSLVICWRYLAESHVKTNRRRLSFWKIWLILIDIIRHPLSGVCLAIQASMSFGLLIWISSSSLILTGHYLVPVKYFGLVFAGTATVQLSGSILCSRLLRYRDPSYVMALGGGCCIIGGGLAFIVTVLTDGSLLWLMTGIWIYMLGFGLIVPSSGGMALHAFGAVSGLAAALLGSAQSLVGSMGSAMSAVLYDGTPTSLGIGIGLSALMASSMALLLSHRLHKKPELLADPD